MSPASYDRYTPFATAFASFDVKGTARLYATLKPLMEEAAIELGADIPFERTVERAVVQLLETPILSEPVPLESEGIGYTFWDAQIESLTPAQKQFLRFGPRNVRLVQQALRNVGMALGIPARDLPALQE